MNVLKTFITIISWMFVFGNSAYSQQAETEVKANLIDDNRVAISEEEQFTPAEIENVTVAKFDVKALQNTVEVNDEVIVDFSAADYLPNNSSSPTITKTH